MSIRPDNTPLRVLTLYFGATDTRGSRIKAHAQGRQASISYPYELNQTDAHEKAVRTLVSNCFGDPDLFDFALTEQRPRGYAFTVTRKETTNGA